MAYHSSESSNSDEEPPSPTRSPRRKCRKAVRGHGSWGLGRGHGAGGRSCGGGDVSGRIRGGRSQNACDQFSWSSTTAAVNVESFTRSVGPAVALSACVLEIFELFFTPALIYLIVEQTNLYAHQTMSDDQYSKWEEVNAEEIWAYMGFMILMGINHLPALSDYWKVDPTYCYSPIADRIT